MITTEQFLAKARALIEKGWVQGTFATTDSGQEADYMSKAATRFCMMGACRRVRRELWEDERFPAGAVEDTAYDLLKECIEERKLVPDIVEFNDTIGRTQADVLEVFDCAIKHAADPAVVEEKANGG
jgi:hypothetical protein